MWRKPSVLHLIGSFHQGGSERQAVQLARLLSEDGRANVHIACLDRSGVLLDEAERISAEPIPEYALTSFYDLNAVRQLRRFIRHLRARKIEIVQTHDFYTNVFGMAAARLAGVPVRIAARRETTGFRTTTQQRVERRAYSFARAIVANSEAVKTRLVQEGVPADKIKTVYNGLDMNRIGVADGLGRDDVLSQLGLPRGEERRFVTIVANLRHPVKDHAMFLRAARLVGAKAPQVNFIIAGEGDLTEPTRELAAQLGLTDAVHFLGRCGEIAKLLFVSDVCVLSSKAEGFSNSILEYMAAARPVVATDVGGAREAIVEGETGYLVASGDDQAMARRITSLLFDPEKARRMGEAGRRIIGRKFSCEAQLESTLNLYETLLARDRQPEIVRSQI